VVRKSALRLWESGRQDVALLRLAASVVALAIDDATAGRFESGEDEGSIVEWLCEGTGGEMLAVLGLDGRNPDTLRDVIERRRQAIKRRREGRSKRKRLKIGAHQSSVLEY
jgi:beta-galactosidase GanA